MFASCFVALLGSASGLVPSLAPPRSYWRFEDPAHFGADSSPSGDSPLLGTANTTASAFEVQPGGVVGSYLSVNGSSPTAAVVAAGGAWGCGGQGCPGSTIELLLRYGQ